MSRLIVLFLVLAVMGPWSTAEAQKKTDEPAKPVEAASKPSEEPSKPESKAPQAPGVSLSHKHQFGIAVRGGTGYRVIMPYDDKDSCGEADKSVCGSRQPFWLEVSPSFGVTDGLEVLVDVRFALESDFTGTKGLLFAPGIKYYTDPEDLFKFFATGQIVFEHQEQAANSGLTSFDIGIRSALGVHFDLLRYFGVYAQGGIIVGFKRWLTFVVDFALGVQGRY